MLSSALRLRHLRTFVAVARQGSVGRAADELAITQPAVSKAIKELEAILGAPLLARERGKPLLSPYGEMFLRHAEASLSALRRGLEAVGDATSPSALPVRIGALPTVSARLLPAAIRRYLAHDLGARPRIVTGPTAYLTAQLREGALDIVIGRMGEPETMTGLVFEHLYSELIVFAVRAGHPLAGRTLRPETVLPFDVLLPPPGSVIRPTVDRLFAAANLPAPPRVVETVSLAFSRAYILATDAIWLISEGVVLEDLQRGVLDRLTVDTSRTQGPVGITMRAGDTPSPAAAILLQELRNVAADIRRG
ncbi:pca operon transcription factor PcaQ [Aureimonas phyllosphaerae]|uniref:LysR family pca operon transcriptional activator n=1 Tax=Aureimonas phyllosphaerae TaxID=1166078 RepID=A0A7W6C3G9_9HYPH|nr:pca operon transcription factor PcaQ [Aureimonas phyllosphaerae]MBB3937767.1 LysR family pca operon transcriptional activator [Aureimonas phyllosphaerae]MBB3961698.1 LysR family pca operon transcriptional activator [Aureimonas phyllosphaerae]SFF45777.1 LysR family transcriptional regulator, pca operon transcriptional activator [Aureimonas phyllosphaerae]